MILGIDIPCIPNIPFNHLHRVEPEQQIWHQVLVDKKKRVFLNSLRVILYFEVPNPSEKGPFHTITKPHLWTSLPICNSVPIPLSKSQMVLNERAGWGAREREFGQTTGTCVHQTRPYILNENCVLVAVHTQKELYTVSLYSLLFAPWLLKLFGSSSSSLLPPVHQVDGMLLQQGWSETLISCFTATETAKDLRAQNTHSLCARFSLAIFYWLICSWE